MRGNDRHFVCGCRWWQQALGTCECSIIPLTHSSSAMWWVGPHPQMASSVFSLSPSPHASYLFPLLPFLLLPARFPFFSSFSFHPPPFPLFCPFSLLTLPAVSPFTCSCCLSPDLSSPAGSISAVFMSKLGAMLPIVTCKALLNACCCSLTTLPSLFPRASHMRHLLFLYNLPCCSVCSVLSHHLSAHSLTYCSVCFAFSLCLCGRPPLEVCTVHAHESHAMKSAWSSSAPGLRHVHFAAFQQFGFTHTAGQYVEAQQLSQGSKP